MDSEISGPGGNDDFVVVKTVTKKEKKKDASLFLSSRFFFLLAPCLGWGPFVDISKLASNYDELPLCLNVPFDKHIVSDVASLAKSELGKVARAYY